MPETIQITLTDESVATITLDRPEKRNALSIRLRDEVSDAFDALVASGTVKVVVVTGAGDHFSAGFDLKEFAVDDAEFQRRLWESSDRFHETILRCPLPTVAAVNGSALAGGFDLAVLCDIRIAADTARFAHPEQVFGDVVYGPLHDLVGGALARDLALTGREMSVEEALRVGLVTHVVSPEELHEEVVNVTRQIVRAPRELLMRTKAKALRHSGSKVGTVTLDL
ncbi:MAG: enoyl-CoA hydratase/isomerase family protein [Actinobacteria bacterium ATB1]|nr:enoyl-CoA hydratase/isomerase family protein [Actinobacteria bacterium ATB1]